MTAPSPLVVGAYLLVQIERQGAERLVAEQRHHAEIANRQYAGEGERPPAGAGEREARPPAAGQSLQYPATGTACCSGRQCRASGFPVLSAHRDRHQGISEDDDAVGGLRQADSVIEQQEEAGRQHNSRHRRISMPLSSIACPANGRWRARSSRLLHNSIIVRVTLNSPAAMAMRREVLNACQALAAPARPAYYG